MEFSNCWRIFTLIKGTVWRKCSSHLVQSSSLYWWVNYFYYGSYLIYGGFKFLGVKVINDRESRRAPKESECSKINIHFQLTSKGIRFSNRLYFFIVCYSIPSTIINWFRFFFSFLVILQRSHIPISKIASTKINKNIDYIICTVLFQRILWFNLVIEVGHDFSTKTIT